MSIPALQETALRAAEHFARRARALRIAEHAYAVVRTDETREAATAARASRDNALDELCEAEHALLAARIAEVA